MKIENLQLSSNIAEQISNPNIAWISGEIKHKELDILQECSYIITPNIFFNKIHTNKHTILYESDYYGGRGIGLNIGSGRTGNTYNFQVKGIGTTKLVGKSDNLYNTSGAYPLYEGITELMMYNMWKDIFPIDMIGHIALIKIGDSQYFVNSDEPSIIKEGKNPLCLLVRDKCVRVASFIRCHHIPEEYNIEKDIERTENNNISFALEYREDFSEPFYLFAENCAKQLSFCRVNRVAHGALSPSNITIYGNWLDLTNMTAVPDNYDTHAGLGDPTFLDENMFIPLIIKEWVVTFNKYNNINIDYLKIIEHYLMQFEENFELYTLDYFGISRSVLKEAKNKRIVQSLAFAYNSRISNVDNFHRGVPREHYDDSKIIPFLDEIFFSAISIQTSHIHKFYRLSFDESGEGNYTKFVILAALSVLKKTIYRKVLYIGNAYLYSKKMLRSSPSTIEIKDCIDGCHSLAKWIFYENSTIFTNENIELKIYGTEITMKMANQYKKFHVEDYISHLNDIDEDKFIIYDIKLKSNVIKILSKISEYIQNEK